uniref:Cytochrome b n=1 Tax=Dolomedes angustivirgatus TaxID=492287 RepID=A0A1C8V6A3_9ARAC|nr:cytochrome b [Dolomedes angustivirgatus]ANW36390.1 cytochrome b [Dolomedes angustivirgatus]
MFLSLRKSNKLIGIVNGSLVDLPSPSSLSYFWNFGSLLGVFLMVQIISGLFLSFHFSGDVNLSFNSIIHTMRDVNYGWLLRVIHANGASMFFLLMYIHIGRGLYYGSYRFEKVWLSGVTILLLSMATAFLGYVLPWGQMSFWAATVITNLLSAVPYIGVMLVEWVWGGFAVGNPTLTRFFAFRFILPFIILFFVILHLFFLHEKGSNNPLGLSSMYDKISFHPYYSMKDVYGFSLFFVFFVGICLLFPYIFMDVENFISSNPLVTPIHIQPEWYFLFAYTILRSVPSKIGGVIALVMSVLVLYFLPFFLKHRFRSTFFYYLMKFMFWFFVVNWMLLTWIGACVVELPYMLLGMYFSVIYYLMYVMFWAVYEVQD